MLFPSFLRMTDPASKAGTLKNATSALNADKARWPLAFKIQPQAPQGLSAFGVTSNKTASEKQWWSHVLYRGPNNERVKILYSKTKADSEALARQFLKEKVVGFDMEWPWDDWKRPDKLQNKVGLIQIATEDKVALFHIGLHKGVTTDDILAPSLRKLIESPSIGKIGVGILNADFFRLSKYFKVDPKAAIELSHLHRLVTFGGRKPELVSTKLTSLANQVEQHLGYPLYKGDVRTSNWSKPLSQEQIKYAAGDAYAGIMLYHCLNYKRLQMKPTPPLPVHAEKYLGYKLSGVGSLYLEPVEEGGKIMTSAFFFGVPTALDQPSESKKTAKSSAIKTKKSGEKKMTTSSEVVRLTDSCLDPTSKALYDALCIRRRAFAAETKKPEYRVASNQVLIRLARERPLSSKALLKIKGVGASQEKHYGSGWIAVISSFMSKNGLRESENAAGVSRDTAPTVSKDAVDNTAPPCTPARSSRRRAPTTPDSSPAFGTPSRRTGQKRKRAESPIKPTTPFNPLNNPHRKPHSSHWQDTDTSTPPIVPARRFSTCHAPMPVTSDVALPPATKLVYNQLVALSRLVATRLQSQRKPQSQSKFKSQSHPPLTASQLISNSTLTQLSQHPPQTREELRRVVGVGVFLEACGEVEVDLLGRIVRFAGVKRG
ncbi:hypothetical protein EKO04_010751 [Ascochyta lentis]|uniref:HRDC domain-containing protein n=1 Tax=Ascochyta lentis TaxID=205686 RepID=A0A8H7IUH2_9PLEO|nr:hypothetical protein EKO04_010751 [Ascochyta lentis]